MTLSRREFIISSAVLAGSALCTDVAGIVTAGTDKSVLDTDALDALLQQAVLQKQTPGIALTVWKAGRAVYSRNAGLSNLETLSPVGNTSIFRIGSLSKQFSAALVLKLVSEGKLMLTDPAAKYLPFLAAHEAFTVIELLNHTAGVHDGEIDTGGKQPFSQIEQAEGLARQQRFFDFSPGSAWLYSNANYILIGAIIEKLTGQTLAEAASTRLFKPLGLQHTAFDTTSDVVVGRASGYTPGDSGDKPFRNADFLDVRLAGAAGAMRSTSSDLCRWQHALFNGQAMPLASAELMLTPGRLRNGQLAGNNRFSADDAAMGETQYGLGLMLDNGTVDKSLIAHHHGGINGFAAYMAHHRASNLSMACLCNVDTHPGLPLRAIRRTVFRDVLAKTA